MLGIGLDGSRPIQTDRLNDHRDDYAVPVPQTRRCPCGRTGCSRRVPDWRAGCWAIGTARPSDTTKDARKTSWHSGGLAAILLVRRQADWPRPSPVRRSARRGGGRALVARAGDDRDLLRSARPCTAGGGLMQVAPTIPAAELGGSTERVPPTSGRRISRDAATCHRELNRASVSHLAERPWRLRTGGVQVRLGIQGSSGKCR